MFERLFQEARTIDRYMAAPLLQSRLRFLEHCAGRGLARRTLQKIARCQVVAVRVLRLEQQPGAVPLERVEEAGARWVVERGGRRSAKKQREFVLSTARWLQFLGRLECPPPSPLPHASALAAFAECLRAEHGASEETIRNYCSRVREFLRRHGGDKQSLEEVTIADIDRAMADKAASGVARPTIRNYATALQAFFRYLEGRGLCRSGLAATVPVPRLYAGETLPVGPSWEDVQRLIDSTAGSRPAAIRDRAILLLLAVYGLRSGEVRLLRLDDIDWEAEILRVRRPKTGHSQPYPLSRTVGDAMLRYLRAVRPRCRHREVFLSMQAPARPLSVGGMWRVVGPRMRRLGIASRRCGPHALRHACAQHLLDTGFSMKEVGDCLGHRSAESTAVYAKVGNAGLCAVADFDWEGVL